LALLREIYQFLACYKYATMPLGYVYFMSKKFIANFKIYERAYHGSKFSAKRSAA